MPASTDNDTHTQSMAALETVAHAPESAWSNPTIPLSNRTTRARHGSINKIIIERIALALPPQTPNPSRYITGLLHILPLYEIFESPWKAFVAVTSSELGTPVTNRHSRVLTSRIRSMLAHLYPAKLVRAQTLREDIAALMEVSVEHVDAHVSDILSGRSEVLQILARISEIIQAKPHVLVAYAWVLYMALFSGGRYIRASLANAAGSGASFWARNPSPVRTSHAVYSGARVASLPSLPIGDDIGAFTGTGDSKTSAAMPLNRIPVRRSSRAHAQCVSDFTLGNKIENQGIGLSLFHFPGEEDGEDLKREFKARLLDVEILLQEQEKLDIVQESVKIFEDLHALVEILDELCALDKPILRDRSGISEAEDTQARKLQSTEDDDLDDDSDEGLSGPETEISSVSSTPLRGSIGGIRIVSTRSLPEARNSLALAQERNKKTHGRTSSPSRHTTNLDTSRRGLTLKTVKGHIDKLVRFNLGPPLTGSHNRYFGVRSNSSITDVTYGKHGLLAVGACFLLFLWAFTGLAIWLR